MKPTPKEIRLLHDWLKKEMPFVFSGFQQQWEIRKEEKCPSQGVLWVNRDYVQNAEDLTEIVNAALLLHPHISKIEMYSFVDDEVYAKLGILGQHCLILKECVLEILKDLLFIIESKENEESRNVCLDVKIIYKHAQKTEYSKVISLLSVNVTVSDWESKRFAYSKVAEVLRVLLSHCISIHPIKGDKDLIQNVFGILDDTVKDLLAEALKTDPIKILLQIKDSYFINSFAEYLCFAEGYHIADEMKQPMLVLEGGRQLCNNFIGITDDILQYYNRPFEKRIKIYQFDEKEQECKEVDDTFCEENKIIDGIIINGGQHSWLECMNMFIITMARNNENWSSIFNPPLSELKKAVDELLKWKDLIKTLKQKSTTIKNERNHKKSTIIKNKSTTNENERIQNKALTNGKNRRIDTYTDSVIRTDLVSYFLGTLLKFIEDHPNDWYFVVYDCILQNEKKGSRADRTMLSGYLETEKKEIMRKFIVNKEFMNLKKEIKKAYLDDLCLAFKNKGVECLSENIRNIIYSTILLESEDSYYSEYSIS